MMAPGGPQATYTKDDLCREAAERGYAATGRLITDWVQLGLLDAPTRRGLGRGKGQLAGTWPEEQRELFLLLLRHRRDVHKKQLAALANIPVSLWAIWGDNYVPLRQVRKALRTWCGPASAGGRTVGERVARSLTRELRSMGPAVKDREAFVHEVGRQFYRGKFDREALRVPASKLFDPGGTGQSIGPPSASLSPDVYLDILEARYLIVDLLQRDPKDGGLSDDEFYTARSWYHTAWQGYAQEQPQLAADPVIGSFYEEPSLSVVINAACENIVLILGLQRTKNAAR